MTSQMDNARLLARLEVLEAESAIRRLVARYFQICDHLGPGTPLDELGQLFTEDARWEGKGRYREAFGGYDGREAIVAMIASYCAPVPHFSMTGHFFSAEYIAVSDAAYRHSAHGEWMMLQCSTYHDGSADLRSACLKISFRREDESWRISHFTSENIFSRRVDRWSDAEAIPVPLPASAGAAR